jgi:hypothetical protein
VWCVGVVSVMWSYRVGPCTALSECKLNKGINIVTSSWSIANIR